MCRFIETVNITDGVVINLELHNLRMNKTRHDIFGLKDNLDLKEHISCPLNLGEKVKCRITYSHDVIKAEYEKYKIRNIKSLRLIESNDIDYSYKYENRNVLLSLYGKRNDCDDILIVKNGIITDTSFSNVVFFDTNNLITPRYPLLNGIKRQKLLNENIITEHDISTDDLSRFQKIGLINSMLDIGDIEVTIEDIRY